MHPSISTQNHGKEILPSTSEAQFTYRVPRQYHIFKKHANTDMSTAPEASKPRPFFINGKDYHGAHSYEVQAPATGEFLYHFSAASVTDAEAAVESAAKALPSWRNTTPAERRDIFLRAADAMKEKSEELIETMSSETGATREWSERNVIEGIDMLKTVAGLVSNLQGSFPALKDPGSSAIVTNEPYGVVLAIAPWYDIPW